MYRVKKQEKMYRCALCDRYDGVQSKTNAVGTNAQGIRMHLRDVHGVKTKLWELPAEAIPTGATREIYAWTEGPSTCRRCGQFLTEADDDGLDICGLCYEAMTDGYNDA